jgi:hypothetical protein
MKRAPYERFFLGLFGTGETLEADESTQRSTRHVDGDPATNMGYEVLGNLHLHCWMEGAVDPNILVWC